MIYLDANFFIFGLLDTTQKGESARKIRIEIMKGKQAITAVLTLDELMWALIKAKRQDLIRSSIEKIYSMSNLYIKEVPAVSALTAVDLMEKYNLKPRDALHAAVMKMFAVKEIVSDDPDFDKIDWVKRMKF